jgi:hypothetical protein
MTGSEAVEEAFAGFHTHNFKQSSWPGPDRTPTMLLLITPYGAPANCTQRKASVVVSTTDEDCDSSASGGMNRSFPTGGSAYGMPFHETTLFASISIVGPSFKQTQAITYVPSFWTTPWYDPAEPKSTTVFVELPLAKSLRMAEAEAATALLRSNENNTMVEIDFLLLAIDDKV